ncbi:protein PHOTOPERIOD-INDEPENDENT EARLY FLOWERING 1-like isoform X2 [Juglans microcarpa x Juglans regia]|uniref:protein PHOTOPERIOD-INDEPENDENT EARLY FLOWERING 1-like isoform X2 n=1 Tax=Juglans microcarpa x Juglans regia TaxID=2249226 RepID=UPI001B7DF35D|nr:protein PHOTOPERIOD-INDEPENDENT EARLY FLOWERING 1-like isoform X2 [Juglans microcarpa x Juglans regia]
MASKGPRCKLDHETRAKRQKALEAPREPLRRKTHWDHVLEEMVWLSKDFESERKWKLAQAKKVALRASRGTVDQATRGEKKMKEEEQRLRKVALNISKDVKKFWMKIEKLVLYKHQMELDEKKKKALDKQLEFLLGQTERYSTMLAENLVDTNKPVQQCTTQDQLSIKYKEVDENDESKSSTADMDEDYGTQSEDESEDDEQTIEEDEALITEEERKEELAALRNEVDLPLEELLKRYTMKKVSRESSPENGEDAAEPLSRESTPEMDGDESEPTPMWEDHGKGKGNNLSAVNEIDAIATGRHCVESNDGLSVSEKYLLETETCQATDPLEVSGELAKDHFLYDFHDEQEDVDFVLAAGEEKDDEATLSQEEELAKADSSNPMDEIALLQKESEIPVEELLARYKKGFDDEEVTDDESNDASALSDNLGDSPAHEGIELKQQAINMDEDVKTGDYQPVVHSPVEEQEAGSLEKTEGRDSENKIADAAAAARSAQPTGNTFSTTKVRTKFPFLLRHPLREYQHIGLDWLVTMYEKRLNGILADEMGLGKTIMTISLLAHLAIEKGIWGPHLIVVPTSVMLNWETEFLKWCPAFKILTYFGSAKERKYKRQGWLKPNSFHVCITTYRLVIQDSKVFKRKKWKYLILDEAHLIKNWKSQRWQTLLNFNSKRRILLTGTPLQNDLMELWSLMHFLMPHVFQSHQEFKDWFSNPISGMVEGQEKVNKEVVDRLHNVLRPFILRRLKRDVEKQLPMKHEHVIYCRLSKRQRNLYEDFIASTETQATLASANFFGMISVIMQLRKVCNHPDLFEGRPIVSSFDMGGIDIQLSSSICLMLSPDPFSNVDLRGLGFLFTHLDFRMTSWEGDELKAIATPSSLIKERVDLYNVEESGSGFKHKKRLHGTNFFEEIHKAIMEERLREAKERAAAIAWWNSLRCEKKPMYSRTLREIVTIEHPVYDINRLKANPLSYIYSSKVADIVLSPVERFQRMLDLVESFMFAIPAARAPPPVSWCSKSGTSVLLHPTNKQKLSEILSPLLLPIRPAVVRSQVYFPDRRLIQFDCGKLQELAILLRKLKSEGHRALIFTQMTKMLDILEAFINLYGYTYMRLDGSTQPEERQTLLQRFNTNPKIFLFILSTRSGGVGINLIGADTVIFYDSDWNPAMDQQAQDRCHRIGQTREVHIYRLISELTIEENILKKANKKRALDDLVIQSGGYNTEFFKKLDPMELFSGHRSPTIKNLQKEKNNNNGNEVSVSNADVEAALKCAEDEADYMALKKVEEEEAVDNQEFTEEAIGRLEDDDFVNEDDLKVDEPVDLGGWITTSNKETGVTLNGSNPSEERTPALTSKEDDVDMLADVKQMAAAAAAAGQAISSFENQLRPIDRYAIRFLEFWDPIIDKAAVESQARFEETEWELDRLERYKEEMEAEIDEDEEPLVYERWDSDFATEAYRQQVEALAQHQLMAELECEAKEKEDAEDDKCDSTKNEMPGDPKIKSKKKPKKAKFKSLKKGSLASELKPAEEETSSEPISMDDEIICHEVVTSSEIVSPSLVWKKRKNAESALNVEEGKMLKKKSKKLKKPPTEQCPSDLDSKLSGMRHDERLYSRPCDSLPDIEQKPASRSRMGGKVSITTMPVKRVITIKPEKLKKANIWSRECVPSPDFWLPQEDAILCAVVHEYGPHWSLVSETLYGMTAGGSYRGRYRHPVHCCERFRELIQRYVLSAPDNPNTEKVSSTGSGKALLKVTEDNIRLLLDVAAEQPDTELLLQKHLTALLSSVWKVTSRIDCRPSLSSSSNGLYFGGRFFTYSVSQISQNSTREPVERMKFTNLGQSRKMLAAALHDAYHRQPDERVSLPNQGSDMSTITEQLEITLEFQKEKVDSMVPLPSVISLSICGEDPPSVSKGTGDDHLKAFRNMAEKRCRASAKACVEDNLGWASSVFPINDVRARSVSKLPSLGKHKHSISDSMKPSKSKFKRTSTVQHGEIPHLIAEPLLEPLPGAVPSDSSVRFDPFQPINLDVGKDNVESNLPTDMDTELSMEMENFEVVPHLYVPGLISGLEDCPFLPEYTDIG